MFSFFKKLKTSLLKTRTFLGSKIRNLFGRVWDAETLHQFEQTLYEADLGSACAFELSDKVQQLLKKNSQTTAEEIIAFLQAEILAIFTKTPKIEPKTGHPLVILIVGVNGSGKTTTIAKLAKQWQSEGKSILLAAGDTFRAAAVEQLTAWATLLGIDIVKALPGSDPAAVVFDALSAAKARATDVVLIDTAGRLHNKTDLMQELDKMRRICDKLIPGAPHQTLLVLDATIGQNALDQARTFHRFTPLTGIVLTKFDGSAKGGIVVAIYKELGIPIQWIGIGETASDLIPFNAEEYIADLFT